MATIPNENDWKFKKIVIYPGSKDTWDCRLYGMISPCAMIKKNGLYMLYYIGSDGAREYPHTDKGPRHRALGVATSSDGINFTKYKNNPILTYSPYNNDEEGIFSAGITLDDNGDVVCYYGAMKATHVDSTAVTGNIRLTTSSDGYNFKNDTAILSAHDSSVWGYGDELFPIGTIKINDIWYLYYTAKGKSDNYGRIYWDIGVAWGSSKTNLSKSKEFYRSKLYVKSGGNPVIIDNSTFALFMGQYDGNSEYITVKTVDINDPTKLKSNVTNYYFDTYFGFVVFYDNGNWNMYYRTKGENTLKVRTVNGVTNVFNITFESIPSNATINKL